MTPDRLPPHELSDKREFIPPQPSSDLAWILGVLSVAGSVNQKKGITTLMSTKIGFLDKIEEMGQKVFGIKAARYNLKSFTKDPVRKNPSWLTNFYSHEVSGYLGDLSKEYWTETITNNHSWVLDNDNFLWEFMSGIFDARGNVQAHNNTDGNINYYIKINIAREKGRLFLASLLKRNGFDNVKIKSNIDENSGSIHIYDTEDVHRFVSKINSRLIIKKELLEKCQDRTIQLINKREVKEVNAQLMPSHEMAWFITTLIAGGNIQKSRGIRLMSKHPEIVKKFSEYSERLFGATVYKGIYTKNEKGQKFPYVNFNNAHLVKILETLQRDQWTKIASTELAWLFDEEFLLDFFTAFFDSRGSVTDANKGNIYNLYLFHPNTLGSELMVVLLSKLGISASILKNVNYKQGTRGIIISKKSEIIKFATKIKSCVASKELKLQNFRDLIKIPDSKIPELIKRREAYYKVIELRKKLNIGHVKISKHPEIIPYNIPFGMIRYWVKNEDKPEWLEDLEQYLEYLDNSDKNNI